MIKKYRKKPVTIEAVQWTGSNKVEIQQFMNQYLDENTIAHCLIIPTLEGDHIASLGDYIIKGVHGEFYPCKPDIFAKTYEDAAIDPESLRPKGVWVGEADGYADGELVYDVWYCSECGYCVDDGTDDPDLLSNFCPNCGADMRETKNK